MLKKSVLPDRYIIMGNMATFLRYILKEEKLSFLLQMLEYQVKYPIKFDWNSEVTSVLAQLQISLSYEEIKHMQKSEFKKIIRSKVEKLAFSQLISKQKPGEKGSETKYGEKLGMADYLLPDNILKLEE